MLQDRIKLIDKDYGYLRMPLSRKIKFKGLSFKNISTRWNNYRLEKLKEKLDAKKDRLVEMEFSKEQLAPGKNLERTKKRVLNKSKAIARLESRINFLEIGDFLTEEFINSRAIKLKNIMMSNLVYNKDSLLYKVADDAALLIVSNEDSTEDNEYEDKNNVTETSTTTVNENALVSEENTDQTIDKTDVKNIIDQAVNSIEEPTISSETVAEAIEREMNNIKASSNNNAPVVTNSFINEDGTYRLKREDIDEDFRITRFNRKDLETPFERSEETATEEVNIPPFEDTEKRKAPAVGEPRKAITAISTTQSHKFPELKMPTIKTENERIMPKVVPERKENSEAISDYKDQQTHSVSVSADLASLMARINLLKAQQGIIESRKKEAEETAANINEKYIETYKKFSAYADSLEADCNDEYQIVNQLQETSAAKEAEMNAMLSMLESVGVSPTAETSKGRGK